MKSYEELLSDIEEDMELMGSSHIVYHGEKDGFITDYDYLPSDSCTISIPLLIMPSVSPTSFSTRSTTWLTSWISLERISVFSTHSCACLDRSVQTLPALR